MIDLSTALDIAHRHAWIQKILQHGMTMLGQDALRVKLHTFYWQRLVTYAHDFFDSAIRILCPGCHFQAIRQRVLRDDQ